MPKFEFEITQTIDGEPDTTAFPRGKSRNGSDGSSQVVVEEFDDQTVAVMQACIHDDGYRSKVWIKHCPQAFKGGQSRCGIDVYYLGQIE